MRMVEALQNFDLSLKHFHRISFELIKVYDFHCKSFFLIINMKCFIHTATITFPQYIMSRVFVFANQNFLNFNSIFQLLNFQWANFIRLQTLVFAKLSTTCFSDRIISSHLIKIIYYLYNFVCMKYVFIFINRSAL